jgi:phage tail sheath protein FI
MIEQSLQNGLQFAVFEPNLNITWAKMKGSCSNFLTSIWRSGGLAGAKPDEAFFVKVGLGETMTSQDILDNNLIVEIGMALVRPAEFIILRIKLKTVGS